MCTLSNSVFIIMVILFTEVCFLHVSWILVEEKFIVYIYSVTMIWIWHILVSSIMVIVDFEINEM